MSPTIITAPDALQCDDVYVDIASSLGIPLYLKCEGFNFAGSIKLRAAVSMVDHATALGRVTSQTTLVESSSGNLGIALSVVAAARSIPMVCVVDPKCNRPAMDLMRALGTQVVVVDEPDDQGGFLTARKSRVRAMCDANPNYLWLNQYENEHSWIAYYESTARLIGKHFPDLDVVFIGVGTGGTLRGCSTYFREFLPNTKVVAVDSVGSVNFGMPPGPRHLPGIGASEPMDFVARDLADDVVVVPEREAVSACRDMARHGFLFGASTGTIVAGARKWLGANRIGGTRTAVAISPDFGERYLDTVYRSAWRDEMFSE